MIEIGSSEAAIVMGCSPFSTPWRLYASNVGLIPKTENEEEDILKWGTRLEKPVLMGFLDDVIGRYQIISQSPDSTRRNGFLRATPDAVVETDYGYALVEVKTKMKGLPPPVPRVDWLLQCLHQRLVFPEVARQYLVCFGGLQMQWWEIPKHEKAEQTVLAAELMFVDMCEKGTPPPVSAMDASYLHKAWPYTADTTVALGAESEEWDTLYKESVHYLKYYEHWKNAAQAKIQEAMGEHTGAVLPNGVSYTWRPYERDGKTYRRFIRRGGDE